MMFGKVEWNEEDIINALDLYGLDITDDLVDEVISKCEDKNRIQEAMIEAGWNVIYSILDDIEEGEEM